MDERNEAALAAETDSLPKGWLSRIAAGAGITSVLGDFCCETTAVILKGSLTVLGIPAACAQQFFRNRGTA
jgi:hypothetical protein